MRDYTKKKLNQKGWTQKEIHKAEMLLEQPREHDLLLANILFFSALLLIIVGNIAVSIVLIPFLLFFNKVMLYVFVVVLAAITGFLYNFLIHDINHLKIHHHFISSFIIPILALVNVVIIAIFSNRIIVEMHLQETHNPFLIAGLFAVIFLLPYFLNRILRLKERKSLVKAVS